MIAFSIISSTYLWRTYNHLCQYQDKASAGIVLTYLSQDIFSKIILPNLQNLADTILEIFHLSSTDEKSS